MSNVFSIIGFLLMLPLGLVFYLVKPIWRIMQTTLERWSTAIIQTLKAAAENPMQTANSVTDGLARQFYAGLFSAGGAAIIILFVLLGLNYLYPSNGEERSVGKLISDFFSNGGAEFMSIAVTVLVINQLAQRREKQRLIVQLNSTDNDATRNVVQQLRAFGWLTDSSLRGQNFEGADWTGLDLRNADLQGANLTSAILKDAQLEGANLENAILVGASLYGAMLTNANLSHAKLMKANLTNTQLNDADLTGCNFTNANGSSTNLVGSTLAKTDFTGAKFQSANLESAVLTETNFHGANLIDATIEGGNLRTVNLNGAILAKVSFMNADLRGVDLSGLNLNKARFEGTTRLRGANLQNANLSGASLKGADLSTCNLMGANLRQTDFSDADLTGTNLEEASLDSARFIKADLHGSRLPRDIDSADFSDANLRGIDLKGVRLKNCVFVDANLSNSNLENAKFVAVNNLTGVDLSKAILKNANLYSDMVTVNGISRLVGATLNQANLREADLQNADLRGVRLNKANLEGTNLRGSCLQGADIMDITWASDNIEALNATILPDGSLWHEETDLEQYVDSMRWLTERSFRAENAYLRGIVINGRHIANLELEDCDLQKAYFQRAHIGRLSLSGCDLTEANFTGAKIRYFALPTGQGTIILPDGTTWNGTTDFEMFTNSEHPQYWSPE